MSRTLKSFFVYGSGAALLLAGWLIFDFFIWVPDFTKLRESVSVEIKLANGDKSVRQIGPMAPGWVPLSSMAESVPRAVVASEDASFYSHKGIDVFEMQEAFKKDLKEGRFARGASTLTQQVLKNVYLTNYPRIWRKVKEIAWASKLEAALSKQQILAFYLNMAEWGPGIYGIGEASRLYFNVAPSALTPREAAFLTMLLPSPRRYHAYFKKRALTQWAANRVNRILTVMSKMGQLSPEAYQAALAEPLWGAAVVSDNAPGAPVDPGWD
ncbi:transglycosylase domain-containing protein, partial [bacterium]|nr:transglycosylase domain-containing protein [bacterium]